MNQRDMIAMLVRMMEAWMTVTLQLVTVTLLQALRVTLVMIVTVVLTHPGATAAMAGVAGEGEARAGEDQE